MYRIGIVIAIALLIFQQSDCLILQNNRLINRCGIWQKFTGNYFVLLIEKKPEAIVFKNTPTPEPIITLKNNGTYNISGNNISGNYVPSFTTSGITMNIMSVGICSSTSGSTSSGSICIGNR